LAIFSAQAFVTSVLTTSALVIYIFYKCWQIIFGQAPRLSWPSEFLDVLIRCAAKWVYVYARRINVLRWWCDPDFFL